MPRKFFILFFILLSCNTDKKLKINTDSEILYYDEFFSKNVTEKNSLALDSDSIFFLLKTGFDDYPAYLFEKYEFDSTYNYTKKAFTFEKTAIDSITMSVSNFKNRPVFIKELGKFKFKSDCLPKEIIGLLKIRGLQSVNTICQKYGNTYFIADNSCITKYPQMLAFDTITKKIDTIHFDMSCSVLKIKYFFLYDLKKDGVPEIFVITTSNIPRTDALIFWSFTQKKGITPPGLL